MSKYEMEGIVDKVVEKDVASTNSDKHTGKVVVKHPDGKKVTFKDEADHILPSFDKEDEVVVTVEKANQTITESTDDE